MAREKTKMEISKAPPHLNQRLLAVEVRPQRIGFAVFEGPDRLLDWGVRDASENVRPPELIGKKIGILMDLYLPSATVVRQRRVRSARLCRRIETATRVIRREARQRAIKFHTLASQVVQRSFANSATKHEIASRLVERFPELSWKLPTKRKVWKSEDYGMVIFDAAAAGLAFFGQPPASVK